MVSAGARARPTFRNREMHIRTVGAKHRHQGDAEVAGAIGEATEALGAPKGRLRAVVAVLPIVAAFPAGQEGEDPTAFDALGRPADGAQHVVVGVEDAAGPVHAVDGQDERDLASPGRDIHTLLPGDQPMRALEVAHVIGDHGFRGGRAPNAPGWSLNGGGHPVRGLFVDHLDAEAVRSGRTPETLEADLGVECVKVGVVIAGAEEDERRVEEERVPEGTPDFSERLLLPVVGDQVTERQAVNDQLEATDALGMLRPRRDLDAVGGADRADPGAAGVGSLAATAGEAVGLDVPGAVCLGAGGRRRVDSVGVLERDDLEGDLPAAEIEERVGEVEAELLRHG